MPKKPLKKTDSWRQSIVGHAEIDPRLLTPHPQNWRTHPQTQDAALTGSLTDLGWIRSITVNETTGHIVDGHARLALALARGEATVPVEYVALTPEQEQEALLVLDPIAALAEANLEPLTQLLHAVQSGDAGIQALLTSLAEQQGILPPPPVDYEAAWQGMPAFEQEAQNEYQTVIVHFLCEADVHAFAALVQQPITRKTKFLYYPAVSKDQLASQYYAAEVSAVHPL